MIIWVLVFAVIGTLCFNMITHASRATHRAGQASHLGVHCRALAHTLSERYRVPPVALSLTLPCRSIHPARSSLIPHCRPFLDPSNPSKGRSSAWSAHREWGRRLWVAPLPPPSVVGSSGRVEGRERGRREGWRGRVGNQKCDERCCTRIFSFKGGYGSKLGICTAAVGIFHCSFCQFIVCFRCKADMILQTLHGKYGSSAMLRVVRTWIVHY